MHIRGLTQDGRIYKAMAELPEFSVIDLYRAAKARPLRVHTMLREELRARRLIEKRVTSPNRWGLSFPVYVPASKLVCEQFLNHMHRHSCWGGNVFEEATDFLDPLPELFEALEQAKDLCCYVRNTDEIARAYHYDWRVDKDKELVREGYQWRHARLEKLFALGGRGMYEDGPEANEAYAAYWYIVLILAKAGEGDYEKTNLVAPAMVDRLTQAIGYLMLLGPIHAERAMEAAKVWHKRTQR